MEIKPYDWQMPLISAQTAALRDGRFFVNACGTGAGKTVMALQSAKDLGGRCLVVAPIVSHGQWRRTAEAMGCAELLLDVVNIEKVSRGHCGVWYSEAEGWRLPKGTLVVLDECHRGCSGAKSKATKAFAMLKAYKSVMLLAMSATLASNPMQLRLVGYWAGLHDFTVNGFNRFCLEHGCRYEQFGWGVNRRRQMVFTKSASKAKAEMSRIRGELGGSLMAYGPADIPGFPTETVAVKLVELDKRDREEIDAIYAKMSEKLTETTGVQLVDSLHERMRVELLKSPAIVELALEYLRSITDNYSVVLFVSFTETRKFVEEALAKAGVESRSVYGGMKDDERQAGIDAFQSNDVHCLVCMSQAASCAMSAHDVKHERQRVSLISPSFSASDMKQALGRIRRVGGTHATQLFVLAEGTVEEDVARSLNLKIKNIDTLNDSDLMPGKLKRRK